MVQTTSMRLDHVKYVTSHDQLADTVQRFGTRNFTQSHKKGKYVEAVCPLDHPATEQTPWVKAVSKRAQEGGGWLTWIFAT